MRARLAFALSLMIDFDCYLIDEVVAVGDSRFQDRCQEELFVRRKDRAMILVSHDPHYMRDHCERACVLADGKLHHFDAIENALQYHQQLMAA
jgi:capsular polysaccharide transport system ATP-binding protein